MCLNLHVKVGHRSVVIKTRLRTDHYFSGGGGGGGMRNFPLQTIFLNLFVSAIIFFSTSTFVQTIFFFYIFYSVIFFFGAQNISAIFRKKITNTIADNYYFSHLCAPSSS